MTSGARARAFLSRFASVPLDAGAVREFLQHRLRLLATYCFWIGALTWGVNALLNAFFFAQFAGGRITSARSLVHGTTAITWGLAWLGLRRGTWSVRTLSWIDVFGTSAMALGLAGMVRLGDAGLRSDMVGSMAVGHLLVLRAAILPSTGRRTAAIGALAELPIIVMAYLLHARPRPEAVVPSPTSVAAALVVWALLAIATTTVISSAIYGLSERVREASRLGQYTLEHKIGEGGMGVVYRARHALLRRPTAIKLLSSSHATEAQLVRFEREVQSTAMLSHPNVVSIYDYGRSATGVFYYAMEYVDGIDLEHLVAHDGPQPEARVRDLLIQAADALREAHGAGLVHRDVKPSNMILSPKNRGTELLKIVDFGLVKQTSAENTSESGVFEIKGTPLYMAPEVITATASVDARTDLYSLGAVGYFLLTGDPVFKGESVVEICGQHLHVPPEPPSRRLGRAVSPGLERTLLACLAKSPAQRPGSAADLLAMLDACDECQAFSVADAQRWWAERAPAVRARIREELGSSASSIRGLRVDPKGRS